MLLYRSWLLKSAIYPDSEAYCRSNACNVCHFAHLHNFAGGRIYSFIWNHTATVNWQAFHYSRTRYWNVKSISYCTHYSWKHCIALRKLLLIHCPCGVNTENSVAIHKLVQESPGHTRSFVTQYRMHKVHVRPNFLLRCPGLLTISLQQRREEGWKLSHWKHWREDVLLNRCG